MSDRRTWGLLIVVQVLFGLLPVATKVTFRYLDPFPLAAVRITGGALAMIVLTRWLARGTPVPLDQAPRVTLYAFLGVIINQGLFIVGLQKTTAIHATLLITTIPVFTYAVALLLGREIFGPRRMLGLATALTGVAFLLGFSNLGPGALVGDLMITINSLSYAAFLVVSKPMAEKYDPFSLTTGLFIFGALFFLPIGIWMGLGPQVAAMPPAAWAIMAFIIAGPTVGAYVINNTALRTVPSSTVAVFIFLQPVIATASAALWLDERLTWRIFPAAALVFLGVWAVAIRRPVRAAESESFVPRPDQL